MTVNSFDAPSHQGTPLECGLNYSSTRTPSNNVTLTGKKLWPHQRCSLWQEGEVTEFHGSSGK